MMIDSPILSVSATPYEETFVAQLGVRLSADVNVTLHVAPERLVETCRGIR